MEAVGLRCSGWIIRMGVDGQLWRGVKLPGRFEWSIMQFSNGRVGLL